MKKLILLIALLLFVSTTFVSAKELDPKNNYERTTQELTTLLRVTSSSLVGELENEMSVRVKFMLTANNEIVVLETNSSNLELNSYIKSKLNYKSLSTNELEVNKDYVFNIKFKL